MKRSARGTLRHAGFRARSGPRLVPLALLLLVLLPLASGCLREPPRRKAAGTVSAPSRGGTLRILHEVAGTLDPVLVDDVYEGTVVNQVFEGLVQLDSDLSLIPALAESWIVSQDGRVYEFHLRPGVRFHDGRPLTAEAVVHTFERALSPGKGQSCLAETYLMGIEGADDFVARRADHVRGLEARGPGSVTLRLREPLSFFLSVLCMDQLKIVPPDYLPGEHDRLPVGTGPFRFVRRRPDGGVDLARNEAYWGTPALVDTLSFIGASNIKPEEEVARLLHHEVDAVRINRTQRSLVEGVEGFRILRSPDVSVTFIGLNTSLPPLDRPGVRQAIALAVDRPQLAEAEAGEQELATGILPPRLAGYQPTPKVLPLDRELARRKLLEEGYSPAHPLPPIDLYTTKSSRRRIEAPLARQLEEVGIRLRTHELSWPDLDERITRGRAPLFTLSWVADVPDPDSFLYFLFRTGEANNMFAFSDAEVDSLLALGRRTKPGPERFAVYRRAESRVLSLAPIIPLYHLGSLYAWNQSVRGVEANPFGFALTPFARIWFDPGGSGVATAENIP